MGQTSVVRQAISTIEPYLIGWDWLEIPHSKFSTDILTVGPS